MRRAAAILSLLLSTAACFTIVPAAHADDVADEADLHFQLGATKYKAGDYLGALEHFLASNRLAPNRNVVFNIARCYERLERYPDAYRAYTSAYEGETNADRRKSIEEALAQIAPKIAVLEVVTSPPGATIYLNRKDLGARGASPRLLGLAAGKYTVIAELTGYETATAAEVTVDVGSRTKVELSLVPLLATVAIAGKDAEGAAVRVDDPTAKPACVAPCSLQLLPGKHALFLTRVGRQRTEIPLDLAPKSSIELRPAMPVQTANVVLDADVHGALIEIDGKPSGFTPAVVQVPIGKHTLRVSLVGYHTEERSIEVAAEADNRIELQLTESNEVIAASRLAESIADAPASVTIIPKYELVGMGYPTIAEALRGVRGVYVNDDRSYASLGFRGFARTGDYGNRVLVTVDGQPTNDNYVGSSYVGFDGRTDLDDVERIEVIRGPGSALYGTSAVFGVVNLVTRSRSAPTHVEAGMSAVEYGVLRGRVHATYRIDDDAGFWISLSGARTKEGRDFVFPEYAAEPGGGASIGNDGFNAGTLSGRAWYKSLTLQWFAHARKKHVPTGIFDTNFPSNDLTLLDRRSFLELRFEPHVGSTQLLTRAHFNTYDFDQTLPYPFDVDPTSGATIGGYERDSFRGRWVGLEQRITAPIARTLRITVGGEAQLHLRTQQIGRNAAEGVFLDRNDPFQVAAGYFLADWTPSSALKVSPAVRVDYYSIVGAYLNPRLAVLLHLTPLTTMKLLGGKAFRAPSVYELFYVSGVQRAPDSLRPEDIYSGEIEINQRFSATTSATLAGYVNYVRNLVVLTGGGTPDDKNVYSNFDRPVLSTGVEGEVRRDFRQGWMISSQVSLQRTRYLRNVDASLRDVPNSPSVLAAAKLGIPIITRTLGVMMRLSYIGSRFDRYDKQGDLPQQKVDAALVWDVVFGGETEKLGVRYGIGVYNLLDTRWYTPVSAEHRQRAMLQNGRTLFLSLAVTL
jgi:outer membrane receptor for ferrienterochelin and colicin